MTALSGPVLQTMNADQESPSSIGMGAEVAPVSTDTDASSNSSETETSPTMYRVTDPTPTPTPESAPAPLSEREPILMPLERSRWYLSLGGSVFIHAAVAALAMVSWPFGTPDEAPPPAALVVELAVMPSSPPVPPTEIPPGPEQLEAAPKPKPVEHTKFDPPPQVDPILKPDFVLPTEEKMKLNEDLPLIAETARVTTAPPAIKAPVEDRSKAPVEGNQSAPPSDAELTWEGRLLAKLERNKRYPAAAQRSGQEDTVFLRLVLDRRGRLLDATIKKSRGFGMLDSETLALARRASPFPAPPASIRGERIVRVVPVEFYIKKRR